MLIQRPSDIPSSEITPERVYHNRRDFIKNATWLATAAATMLPGCVTGSASSEPGLQGKAGPYDTTEKQTPYEYVTTYNNFYEFGSDKGDPGRNAPKFQPPKPWTVVVEGLVKNPATYQLDDLLKGLTAEDRVYRMRCVERWSMVIPWRGYPLAAIIKKLEPAPAAKFVEFHTIVDKNQMPGQRSPYIGGGLNWPYREGLRLDEATNPLALFATGVYGKPLLNQNGAPLRLVTPWKYGFKGIKAIVRIRFVDKLPVRSWMDA